jgi:ABC-type oligopeptide transport system substrate-binding subunit
MSHWRSAVAALTLFLVPVAAAAAPEGKVVIAQGVDPTTLDMMNQSEQPASNVGAQMFDMLVARDQSLTLVPELATELPKLVAPTVWEIKLRKGVKFHNGETFDAESVKFSLERLANPANKLRGSPTYGPIDRVEIVDPYLVRVHTKKPWPTFVAQMALRQASMYPPKEYAGKDPAAISKNPIGTGPYKFVRWSKDEEIVLEAVPNHWRGPARIKTVVFRPIPDDAVRVAALQNGEIDVAVNIPPHLAGIIEKHPKLFLSSAPSIRTIQLMVYTHQMDPTTHKATGPYAGPTTDKRVRQAMVSAIDADEIIRGVMDGKAVRMATMLTSMHFGFDPTLKPAKQDLARTKKRHRAQRPAGALRARPRGRGSGQRAAHQGGDPHHAPHARVRGLPQHHGLRAQGGAGVADRLGPSRDGRRGHLRAPVQVAGHLRQLGQRRLQRHGRGGAERDGREEAAGPLPPDQQALDRGSAGGAALPADRPLRREQAPGLEGAQRRADPRLRHGAQARILR